MGARTNRDRVATKKKRVAGIGEVEDCWTDSHFWRDAGHLVGARLPDAEALLTDEGTNGPLFLAQRFSMSTTIVQGVVIL